MTRLIKDCIDQLLDIFLWIGSDFINLGKTCTVCYGIISDEENLKTIILTSSLNMGQLIRLGYYKPEIDCVKDSVLFQIGVSLNKNKKKIADEYCIHKFIKSITFNFKFKLSRCDKGKNIRTKLKYNKPNNFTHICNDVCKKELLECDTSNTSQTKEMVYRELVKFIETLPCSF